MKDKRELLKLVLPVVLLGVIALWSVLLDTCFGWLEIYRKYKLLLEIFPQCVFPYNGFFNANSAGIGNQQFVPLFGWPGWITSLIHWAIIILSNYWITRKTSLLKSFILFLVLGFSSIAFIFYLLGSMGWSFGINGL